MILLSLLAACITLHAASGVEAGAWHNGIRPPATPLLTLDPYFSLWSMTDVLTDDVTRHWTLWKQPLLGAVRVDGKVYRIIGSERMDPSVRGGNPAKKNREDADAFYYMEGEQVFPVAGRQTDSNVLPTRTFYTFRCGGVIVEIAFTSPLVLTDVELLSRPVSYISWKVRSADGRRHDTELYLEASPRFAMDRDVVPMRACKGSADGIDFLRTGTVSQDVLGKRGDDVRIDWGWFYLGTPAGDGSLALAYGTDARRTFVSSGSAPVSLGESLVSDNFVTDDLALVYVRDLGKVGKAAVSDYVMLGYDDIYSIRYLREHDLRPWWNRDGTHTLTGEMAAAASDYDAVMAECEAMDRRVVADALAAGGSEYADLCALAYRQAIAAHKLVAGPAGQMFFFSKENFSNGCCGTVDVTYPSMPLFLLYNNDIARALIDFIFDYSEGSKWTRTWAPHDVGVYPDAYGQHYGNHMPLEECGNMLLLTAAVVLNGAGAGYAAEHWVELTKWVLYAIQHGQMPENQLCTDDFAGKLAHNVNLSAKSILGVAAYAKMAELLGKDDQAEAFRAKAEEMARFWKRDAAEDGHYRLAFDAEGTWSLKYNLVWDRLLGTGLFGDVIPAEMEFYRTKFNTWGIPLDSRKMYSKTDWQLWVASMASTDEEFRSYVSRVWKFYDETPDRVPMCDWVDTDALTMHAMHARSVVGGFYMKVLSDSICWR